jgi:predicted RNase H-like HicB family nuclease
MPDPVNFPLMILSAVLTPASEGGFVALNPETGATTQGETVEEALANLREATELYLEEFPLAHAGTSLLTTFEVAEGA